MTITDRMLTGAIANNPANYAGDGEWRYSIPHRALYFTRASEPDPRDKISRGNIIATFDADSIL
ncbi:MAG: hypothetical protein ACPL8I_05280, partial [Chloroflexaceae bacterium]